MPDTDALQLPAGFFDGLITPPSGDWRDAGFRGDAPPKLPSPAAVTIFEHEIPTDRQAFALHVPSNAELRPFVHVNGPRCALVSVVHGAAAAFVVRRFYLIARGRPPVEPLPGKWLQPFADLEHPALGVPAVLFEEVTNDDNRA